MPDAAITGLSIYPVKSLGGISLTRSEVGRRGLQYDRRWMLVDEDGVFMTQRTDTRLALFRTAIEPEGIRLTGLGNDRVLVPFEATGMCRSVCIWKDTCTAVQVSDEVDDWFSQTLCKRCSLVHMPDTSVRSTNPEFTRPGDMVGFADAFPVLVIGESSLADLNSRLDVALPMNRFRPNIIVRGCEPFAEDGWGELQIGDLTLRAAKQCGRCSVTATNQETGEVGIEPLRTLAEYRRGPTSVLFGAYFVPESDGAVAVGDTVSTRSD